MPEPVNRRGIDQLIPTRVHAAWCPEPHRLRSPAIRQPPRDATSESDAGDLHSAIARDEWRGMVMLLSVGRR